MRPGSLLEALYSWQRSDKLVFPFSSFLVSISTSGNPASYAHRLHPEETYERLFQACMSLHLQSNKHNLLRAAHTSTHLKGCLSSIPAGLLLKRFKLLSIILAFSRPSEPSKSLLYIVWSFQALHINLERKKIGRSPNILLCEKKFPL